MVKGPEHLLKNYEKEHEKLSVILFGTRCICSIAIYTSFVRGFAKGCKH